MFFNTVETQRLRPHPKNAEYFADIQGEKREELKRSIEAHGIRDPLKVLPDYTIIAGHGRWQIARELGIERVPMVIYDIPPEEAEYLLIADNEERRTEDNDPMRKARRAKFLAEYWGIRRGGDRQSNRQNGGLKTVKDIAEVIGEAQRSTERLLKLNELIPELQSLVSAGKLGTTAAEQIAYLSPETQRELYKTLGEEIGAKTVAEVKALRAELQRLDEERETARKEFREAERAYEQAALDVERLEAELHEARARVDEMVERRLHEARKKWEAESAVRVESELVKARGAAEAEAQETIARLESELAKAKESVEQWVKRYKERDEEATRAAKALDEYMRSYVDENKERKAKVVHLQSEVAAIMSNIGGRWAAIKTKLPEELRYWAEVQETIRRAAQELRALADDMDEFLRQRHNASGKVVDISCWTS
ncbi:MAG: ParB N-terminal domain-containing protein [Alicyclobacillus sp.]|nr:ParB N-terminal domain-containing protein [Alicyclobacillus sp.]